MVTYIWHRDDCSAFYRGCAGATRRRRAPRGREESAPESATGRYGAFLLGFFGFHWSRAAFMQDGDRAAGARRRVIGLCAHLGLGAGARSGFPPRVGASVADIDKHTCCTLARRVRRFLGQPAMRSLHFGYLLGMTCAALVGHTGDQTGDSEEQLAVTLRPCLEMLLCAGQDSGASDSILTTLARSHSILIQDPDRGGLEHCAGMLTSVLQSLLTGQARFAHGLTPCTRDSGHK